ncbi:PqqD family protein, partial [Caldicellulosiruptoraceae bacterium PP1]
MVDIINYLPKLDEQNLLYKRLEEDGSLIFLSKKHPETQQLSLNDVGRFILEQCNGKTTIGEIVNRILKEYYGASKEKITNDVINILHSLWRFGLIQWIGENPLLSLFYNMNDGDFTFKMLYEDQVIETLEKLKKKQHFINPYIDEKIAYSETAVRQKVFIFIETFFA